MDYTVHGILQATILEWGAFSFSRGIFPTQGWNPGLPCCRWILYQLSHQGSPLRIREASLLTQVKESLGTRIHHLLTYWLLQWSLYFCPNSSSPSLLAGHAVSRMSLDSGTAPHWKSHHLNMGPLLWGPCPVRARKPYPEPLTPAPCLLSQEAQLHPRVLCFRGFSSTLH